MNKQCHKNLTQVTELVQQMIRLADDGEIACTHQECLLIFSLLRDSAYDIRRAVANEIVRANRIAMQDEFGGNDKIRSDFPNAS